MSTTHSYLSKRLGILRSNAATTEHDIARLQKQHEAQIAELAEIEAALAVINDLAAIEAGTDPDETENTETPGDTTDD
ncbi:hypothetical protein [Promicromonospora sp. NPDC023805]|uniref:hypothetical protein n=1 Tax=Promicromonospora sp. NPDC023805 TaxID=3154696 RepID=UPI0033EA9B12